MVLDSVIACVPADNLSRPSKDPEQFVTPWCRINLQMLPMHIDSVHDVFVALRRASGGPKQVVCARVHEAISNRCPAATTMHLAAITAS